MIIQCPACKTQAQFPSSKEGSKVRCAECGRVYVARPLGQRGGSKTDPTKYIVIAGVVLVLGVVYFIVQGSPDHEFVVEQEEEEPEPEPVGDLSGWNSPLVKLSRSLHDLAGAGATDSITDKVDAEYAWRRRNEGLGGPPPSGKPEWAQKEDGDEPEPWPATDDGIPWAEAPHGEKLAFADTVADELTALELVADWEPFDGWVADESDDEAIVRVEVSHRDDPSLPNQFVEWRFVKRGSQWKAWYWERWYSDEELAAYRKSRPKKTVKKTLSDGSVVIEGNIRPIGHHPDTPLELAKEIDKLATDLMNLDARPAVRTAANDKLVEIGKPAIPALLTKLATTPLETEEQAMQLNLVHLALGEITGYVTTFKVHELLGATKERQESGLKQWFGWYDRKYRRFEARAEDEPDPFLDVFEARSERERREFEAYRRELEEKKKKGKN